MEVLTTKRLNDQIVFMRKEVKRAIVHQIHRLTTAAKRLRSKKGTEEQKEKNALKADNMVAEISILKKLKADDVSVFGLTNFEEVEVKNFISRRVIAPETKAMAKLCLRKNMRSVIDQFIKEIGSAQSRLMELLDERQQHKEKKENKKQKKQGKNEEINHVYDDTSDSTLDSSDDSIPDLIPAESESDHDSGTEKLTLLDNSKNDTVVKKVDIDNTLDVTHNMKKKPVANNTVVKKVESDNNLDIAHNIKKKPVAKQKNIPKSSDSESESHSIELVDKSSNESNSVNKEDKLEEISKTEKKPLERKNVDPFFMTRDNSEYRTYCNIAANAKKEKDEGEKSKPYDNKNFKNDFKAGHFNKRNHSNNDFFNKNKHNQRFDSRNTITYLGGSDRKSFDKKGFKKAEKRPHSEEPPSNVKLHPSWEAKKKLSVSAAPFQGKKITFDDDD